MRRIVQYISDLHLGERRKCIKKSIDIKPLAPILVVAGDLGNPFSAEYYHFLKEHARRFDRIVVIAGNHEYYHQESDSRSPTTFHHSQKRTREIVSSITKCSFLERDTLKIDNDLTIAGCTLWTKVDPNNRFTQFMYDHKTIKSDSTNWSYSERNSVHQSSVEWLKTVIESTKTKNLLVMTHHVPLENLISKTNMLPNVKQRMVGDCIDLLNVESKINQNRVWLFGHAHQTINPKKVFGWTFASNPCPTYKRDALIKNKTIEF